MFTFEEERMSDIFTKYHIKGFPFDAVIHRFTAPDGGDFHDHPFTFRTVIAKGSYIERIWNSGSNTFEGVHRKQGDSFIIHDSTIHRVIEVPDGECYTIIFPQERKRTWGFYRFEGDTILHRYWNETEFKPIKITHGQSTYW